jgi:CBS domain-containing protein
MKVQDAMTSAVRSVPPSATLAEVAGIMWDADCGIVPVVNERNEVVGVVTDRDIAIALGTRGQTASQVRVSELMSTDVVGCAPEDTLTQALAAMQQHRIHRLPVLGIGDVLLGMLSLNDIVLAAPQPVAKDPVIAMLRGVCAHRRHLVVAHAS